MMKGLQGLARRDVSQEKADGSAGSPLGGGAQVTLIRLPLAQQTALRCPTSGGQAVYVCAFPVPVGEGIRKSCGARRSVPHI